MSTSRIKNIIIIVLLLLDLILLGVFIFDRSEAAQAAEAEIEALADVLEGRGISLDKNIDFSVSAPAPATVLRDEKNDSRLMDKLIDYSYFEDMGGNVFFYSSDVGEAMLRGTGELDLVFNEDLPAVGNDFAASLSKYMGRKGVELYAPAAEATPSNTGATVVIPCMFNDFCVYNAKLSFTVSGGHLMMIIGTRVFDGELKVQDEKCIDSVSALMHFVEIINEKGHLCRSISGLEAGYFMNVAISGECTLRPVWKISTDIGEFYINAVSGKAESLPA